MKRIVAGLLAVAIVFGSGAVLPVAELTDGGVISVSAIGTYEEIYDSGDFSFGITKNGKAVLLHYKGTGSVVNVPATFYSKDVIGIDENAFSQNLNIVEVHLPNTINFIYDFAFSGCENLKKVNIPIYIQNIGQGAFSDTAIVKNQKSDVKYVGNWVVDYSGNLSSISINNGTVGIAAGAFIDANFNSISIPNSIKYICSSAFSSCSNLESIDIPNSVIDIESFTFEDCTSLTDVTMGNNVKSIDGYAFSGCSNLKNINLPDSITSMGYHVFSDCANLKSIHIPNSLTELDDVFSHCTGLTSIEIPSSIKDVSDFNWCENLREITVTDSTDFSFCFSGCKIKKLIIANGSKSITSRMTNVVYQGTRALQDTVEEVIIPNSVTTIDRGAFYSYKVLKKISIPNSVTKIDSNAFSNCESLTSITIPKSVTEIGSNAFYNCTNLTSITIPKSTKEIGSDAFGYIYNNTSSKSEKMPNFKITCYSDTAGEKYAKDNGFDYTALSWCEYNMKDDTTADLWAYHSKDTIITIPTSIDGKKITSLGKTTLGGFDYAPNMTKLIIPNTVIDIGPSFQNCKKLNNVIISNSVANIDGYAFNNCKELKTITIPKSVKNIGEHAFGYIYNDNFKSVKIDNFKIYCYSNTAGEQYAKDNGFAYELLDKPVVNGTGTVNIKNTTSSLKVKNPSVDIGKKGSGKTDKTVKIASDGKFTVEGLADGNYEFTFKADKCVPRTYSVTVKNGSFKLDKVELHLCGDTNGDGKITTADIGRINADIHKTKAISDKYDFAVSDTNSDGKLTTADIGKINAHIRGTKNLW